MKIFFDFDDVLFNTKKFKDDYFQIFKKHGVSKKIFDECYYDPLSKGDIKNYDPVGHIRRICEKVELDVETFNEEAAIFLEDTSEYVFSDVVGALNNFESTELYIISFSKTEFQKAKIYRSGIFDFFGGIEIVDEMKGLAVSEMITKDKICPPQKIFFVDDRVAQIENVKRMCPQVATILCKRDEGRYDDEKNEFCDYEIKNLAELERIIKNGNPRD